MGAVLHYTDAAAALILSTPDRGCFDISVQSIIDIDLELA